MESWDRFTEKNLIVSLRVCRGRSSIAEDDHENDRCESE